MNIDKLMKFNDLVTIFFRRKHRIVLDPQGDYEK